MVEGPKCGAEGPDLKVEDEGPSAGNWSLGNYGLKADARWVRGARAKVPDRRAERGGSDAVPRGTDRLAKEVDGRYGPTACEAVLGRRCLRLTAESAVELDWPPSVTTDLYGHEADTWQWKAQPALVDEEAEARDGPARSRPAAQDRAGPWIQVVGHG